MYLVLPLSKIIYIIKLILHRIVGINVACSLSPLPNNEDIFLLLDIYVDIYVIEKSFFLLQRNIVFRLS